MLLVSVSDGKTYRIEFNQIDNQTLSGLNGRITSVSFKLGSSITAVPTPRFSKRTLWGSDVSKDENGIVLSVRVWCHAESARLTAVCYPLKRMCRIDLAIPGEMRYRHATNSERRSSPV